MQVQCFAMPCKSREQNRTIEVQMVIQTVFCLFVSACRYFLRFLCKLVLSLRTSVDSDMVATWAGQQEMQACFSFLHASSGTQMSFVFLPTCAVQSSQNLKLICVMTMLHRVQKCREKCSPIPGCVCSYNQKACVVSITLQQVIFIRNIFLVQGTCFYAHSCFPWHCAFLVHDGEPVQKSNHRFSQFVTSYKHHTINLCNLCQKWFLPGFVRFLIFCESFIFSTTSRVFFCQSIIIFIVVTKTQHSQI